MLIIVFDSSCSSRPDEFRVKQSRTIITLTVFFNDQLLAAGTPPDQHPSWKSQHSTSPYLPHLTTLLSPIYHITRPSSTMPRSLLTRH